MMNNTIVNNKSKGRVVGFWFSMSIIAILGVLVALFVFEIESSLDIKIGVAVLGVAVVSLFKFGGFDYLIVELKDKTVEVKFYSVFPYGRKFRMIRINEKQISKVEFVNGFLGVGNKMLIYQDKKGQLEKYPNVYLSALSNSEDKALKEFFNSKRE